MNDSSLGESTALDEASAEQGVALGLASLAAIQSDSMSTGTPEGSTPLSESSVARIEHTIAALRSARAVDNTATQEPQR